MCKTDKLWQHEAQCPESVTRKLLTEQAHTSQCQGQSV